MMDSFQDIAARLFEDRHANMLSFGDAVLSESQSERLYDILRTVAPINQELKYYDTDAPVVISTDQVPSKAWIRGYNWNDHYDSGPTIWELSITFGFADPAGKDEEDFSHTIEYQFYNSELRFGVSSFVFSFWETGYEGSNLSSGVLDTIVHEKVLSILTGSGAG